MSGANRNGTPSGLSGDRLKRMFEQASQDYAADYVQSLDDDTPDWIRNRYNEGWCPACFNSARWVDGQPECLGDVFPSGHRRSDPCTSMELIDALVEW
ncbi:MAG: hypothetical protein ACYDHH_02410, partial [Solirubrobacteraceae bacterium]